MNKKEALDQLLKQVDEDKRAPLVEKLRTADKSERAKILEEAGIRIPEDWKAAFKKAADFEVSDEDLDLVSGGCSCITFCSDSGGDCCD